jgi:hypothetical protein
LVLARKVIYQTLQNWGNPQLILQEGPFICTSDDAWMGDGYYFWDTFKELAHWWGESQHNNNYIICGGICDFDPKLCLDLHGEPEDIALVSALHQVMIDENLVTDNFTLNELITYMRQIGLFHYTAIRMSVVGSFTPRVWNKYIVRMHIKKDDKRFIDFLPPIQICFYEKDCMNLTEFGIFYPDHYKTV